MDADARDAIILNPAYTEFRNSRQRSPTGWPMFLKDKRFIDGQYFQSAKLIKGTGSCRSNG